MAKISNERMEYLGDSVLGLVIAEYLFKIHPDYNEGGLTKNKSVLVNEMTLSSVGRECGLNELILMSPDEERAGGRTRNSIVSDTVEAVIAAIYLDAGLDGARRFIKKLIISHAGEILNDSAQRNYKGELLEHLQGIGLEPPRYDVVSEEGPDHQKTFEVVVYTGGKITGSGTGPSKKEAEQIAASQSLKRLLQKKEDLLSDED
jgi:ribonuclease-3